VRDSTRRFGDGRGLGSRTMRYCTYLLALRSDHRFLLLQRGGTSKSFQGYWEFPGGKIDQGETPAVAVSRELHEESGLVAAPEDLRPLRESAAPGEDLHYSFFGWECPDGVPDVRVSDEHSDSRWVTFTEARKLPMRQAHREFLERYWLQGQIAEFTAELPRYKAFEKTLLAILSRLKDRWAPLAIVQARAKSVSSFAGKCLRKADKYDDPARQLTDLCGGRLVATTEAEAEVLCRQIRSLFAIDEDDDTGKRHEISAFGYLSVHFIIHFPEGVSEMLGVPIHPEIGDRKAEIQVRTLLQHAHSEVTHDRLYKGNFTPPDDCRREAARVAAVLESADNEFSRFVAKLDAYAGEYVAQLTPKERARRMDDLSLLLSLEENPHKQLPLALEAARICRAAWDWAGVVRVLTPFVEASGDEQENVRMELGHALCHIHAAEPPDFRRGLELLRSVAHPDQSFDGFLEERDRIRRATALGWLGSVLRDIRGSREEARHCLSGAMRLAPEDPYHLVSFAEMDLIMGGTDSHVGLLTPLLPVAAKRCEDHIRAGIEVARAWMNLSVLRFLQGDESGAVEAICLAARNTDDFLPLVHQSYRIEALKDAIGRNRPFIGILARVTELLALAERHQNAEDRAALDWHPFQPALRLTPEENILIVAGGTGDISESARDKWARMLADALDGFSGIVLSGGTTSGVCGALADAVRTFPEGRVRLVGYVPENLPSGARIDPAYTEVIRTPGTATFSLLEPLQMWTDILAAGVEPRKVHLLCLGGGEIAASELALAWALGAQTSALSDASTAARRFEFILSAAPDSAGGYLIPDDPATVAALFAGRAWSRDPEWRKQWEPAGRVVHAKYVSEQTKDTRQQNLLPWEHLCEELRYSNLHQAAYAAEILHKCGFQVEPSSSGTAGNPVDFTEDEIERMAELEHGRWNAERLRSEWRWGPHKDPAKRISPYIVPWSELPEPIREYDRSAVREWPKVLAQAAWMVSR